MKKEHSSPTTRALFIYVAPLILMVCVGLIGLGVLYPRAELAGLVSRVSASLPLAYATNSVKAASAAVTASLQASEPALAPATTVMLEAAPVNILKGPEVIYTGKSSEMKLFWQASASAQFRVEWSTDAHGAFVSKQAVEYDPGNHLYHITLTDLVPNTRYIYHIIERNVQTQSAPSLNTTPFHFATQSLPYRVLLPATMREIKEVQSASGSFRTAPAASATTLKFLSYGDTRTNPDLHNAVAAQVMALVQSDPAYQTFNLVPGDLVTLGDQDALWSSEFFNPAYPSIQAEMANLPLIIARGNHEEDGLLFGRYFPMPFVGNYYWSFDYGPAHVAVIDQYGGLSANSPQYNWLKQDLEASTSPWKIVLLHEPGWTAGGHENNQVVQNLLQPLFLKTGVSLVIGGHNHYYSRALVDGITHLTVGTGGAPLIKPDPSFPGIQAAWKGNGFSTFEIQGNTLTGTFVDSQGTVRDTFVIKK